jgi:hypothetical protein
VPFDPSKISLRTTRRSKESDPEKIFESLTLRGTIENLWSPQAAALREWHRQRESPDAVIEMNTGGGKTLVGLLVAQSLVNETGKCVLYVCPTNQLVEQASAKAHECGIEVATYMEGSWEAREVTQDSRGPCLTNYAAVFNGKSIFERFDLGGIIFDDAHAAGNIIRSNFSLAFDNGTPLYKEVVQRLRPYFTASHQSMSLRDAIDGDPRPLLFLPMFEARRLAPTIAKLLIDAKVDEEKKTLFAWEHIKDHLGRCVILLSGSRVEITPAALPLHRLRCLSGPARRVYLTATLPSPAEFVKTFGVEQPVRIDPKGKSGEAQRLFIFPAGRKDKDHRAVTKQIIDPRKACVIVPSTRAAADWQDVATLFDGSTGQAGIQRFAQAKGTEKLILAARYDGIDLPGDACRVLVLDGLPKGSHLLTRFLDEALQVASLRASHSAIRVVQAIGRIFRSNTDHGAVVLCGTEVQGWARSPANLRFLPPLLQKQIQLGVGLSESVDAEETTNEELLAAVLSGDRGWDQFYQQKIDAFDISASTAPPSWLVDFAAREQRAYQKIWDGNATDAAADYASLADEAEGHDPRLAAWFRHWEGFSYDLLGNTAHARKAYVLAANVRADLGRPQIEGTTVLASATVPKPTVQAKAIAQLFEGKRAKVAAMLDKIITDLAYGDQTNPVEEALRVLGSLLGLDASRPDKEENTGPDVKWLHPAKRAGVALEAKTNKKETSQYQKKDDIGQFHDHANYLAARHPGDDFRKVIVGRHLRVTPDCHPPDDLRVITLEQFHGLAERLKTLYQALLESDSGELVEAMAERWLQELGLRWPLCVDGLQSKLAVDLQAEEVDGDASH